MRSLACFETLLDLPRSHGQFPRPGLPTVTFDYVSYNTLCRPSPQGACLPDNSQKCLQPTCLGRIQMIRSIGRSVRGREDFHPVLRQKYLFRDPESQSPSRNLHFQSLFSAVDPSMKEDSRPPHPARLPAGLLRVLTFIRHRQDQRTRSSSLLQAWL
jgi:hypothetical protein